ncbi:MAG: hypothetical protein GX754_07485 [Clostridiaceae bacterium]|nr:hypothetical protein [Clostridiaceae bacterium]
MDDMSVVSILCVSFPEEILVVLTTLIIAGYKDALNFSIRKNILKLLLTSIILTVISVAFRPFLHLFIYNVIIALVFYPIVIYFIFKHNIFQAFIGVLLSIVVLIIGEAILLSSTIKLFNISLEIAYSSDIIRFLISLPVRIFQVFVIIILSKVRNIKFHAIKLTTEELVQTILCGLLIISSMVSVEKGLKNIKRDVATITVLIVNICIIVIFSAYLIYRIFTLKNHYVISRKIHNFELERIRNLLKEGYTDHVIELIEETLNERGK